MCATVYPVFVETTLVHFQDCGYVVSVKNPVGLFLGILLRKYKSNPIYPSGVKIINKSQQIPRYAGVCPRGHLPGFISPGWPLIVSLHLTIHLQACAKVCRHNYEKIRNYHNLCIRFGSREICHMNRALKCGNFSENVCPHLALLPPNNFSEFDS